MLVDPLTQLLPAMLGLLVATLYLAAAARLQASPGPWSRLRTASFLAGVVVITGGIIAPGSLGATGHDPRLHMTAHLLFADADRLAAEAGGTVAEWSTAAEIMWCEGDVVELAFVLVFFAQIAGRRHRGRSVVAVPADGRAVPSAAFADDA